MNIFLTIFKLLPAFILGAEATFGNGNGVAKKDMVRQAVAVTIAAIYPPDTVYKVAQALGVIIDATVAAMNATGDLPAPRATP